MRIYLSIYLKQEDLILTVLISETDYKYFQLSGQEAPEAASG